jgi:hypothetical protein
MNKRPSPSCVVKVGGGRGFIIEQRISTTAIKPKRIGKLRLPPFVERRRVITAAHCLPNLPPAISAAFSCERT